MHHRSTYTAPLQTSSTSPPLEVRILLKIYLPFFMSLEPIRVPHGQLEAKDVAHMSYGDETWTTKFLYLAMEGCEGRREHARKVYADRGAFARIWPLRKGIHTASFSPHTNLPTVHLLLPVRCRPRLLQSSSLTFSDVSFNFRHPPISSPSSLRSCTCSTSSISSSDSGPCSGFRTLPRTPPTSDELLRSQSSHDAARHFRVQWWAANVPVQ